MTFIAFALSQANSFLKDFTAAPTLLGQIIVKVQNLAQEKCLLANEQPFVRSVSRFISSYRTEKGKNGLLNRLTITMFV